MGEFLSPHNWMWPVMISVILISWLKKLIFLHNFNGDVCGHKNELINFIFDPRTILLASLGLMIVANLIHNRGILAGREITPIAPLIFISFFSA